MKRSHMHLKYILHICKIPSKTLLQCYYYKNGNTSANREPCNHTWTHQNTSSSSCSTAQRTKILHVPFHQILKGEKRYRGKRKQSAAEDLQAGRTIHRVVCVRVGVGEVGVGAGSNGFIAPMKRPENPNKSETQTRTKATERASSLLLPALCSVTF